MMDVPWDGDEGLDWWLIRGDDGLDGLLGGSSGRSGSGDRFNGNGHLGMGRVTRRGSDKDEKNWGGS